MARVKSYITQAIQPFVDKKICSRFEVQADRSTARDDRIDALVIIYRGPLPLIELRYAILWDEQSKVYSPRTEF